jgi:hypothetical protein
MSSYYPQNPFLKCSTYAGTQKIDLCMHGAQCISNNITLSETCNCNEIPGLIFDHMGFALKTCVPSIIITIQMCIHFPIYAFCLLRMLYLIYVRNLRNYFRRSAISSCISSFASLGLCISIYVQQSVSSGFIICTIFQTVGGSAALINLWLAIVYPVYKTTLGLSMEKVQRNGYIINAIGSVIITILGITCAAYAEGGENTILEYNLTLALCLLFGGTHLTVLTFFITRHATALGELIKQSDVKRVSIGKDQKTQLMVVEQRIRTVKRLSIPVMISFVGVSIIPISLILTLHAAPFTWLIFYLEGVFATCSGLMMLDILTAKNNGEVSSKTGVVVASNGGGGGDEGGGGGSMSNSNRVSKKIASG